MKQFSGAKKWLNDLDSETAGKLITVASDVALVISDAQQGIIRDVSLGSEAFSSAVTDSWIGKAWVDTVTVESRSWVKTSVAERL